ncbi:MULTISPECIES: type II toxin-antitoxin system HicB family antitoxin [Aerococcus]|uniref:Uncharacterized protein n=1 Tax=Aerococcus sanguinicola TaxID=119206 RepID=A0A5N1GIG1_9LACT|nr:MULTISPECIES: type II toxin-antitoxin system HicB family antitoxin [Aerococcus]KAA9300552.1 hypothetical protein F6I03_07020 [Aerococcus sanguinicola]MDK6369651.1 type II toxin-antitoxin system HicB family antitoxin [Aerococcus sp. UMB9870]MDK6680156.1 type II toxin-antitoxin system HicB family antitoxin [Aerococcus sp. UMB8608]MDK6686317.1 type II toxin-antitoxin system HicB family antitoxin [Aerococcus sp. UMB8623]MDK6940237.1 type II toxin-antitoxin system HicB family antitoxin [Aerococc
MFSYYAIFAPSDGIWAVDFPDLDGAYTCGEDMEEALYMAKDLLEGWLIIAKEILSKPSGNICQQGSKRELVINC